MTGFHHTPDPTEATLTDRYDVDPAWVPTPRPIPDPCPVCRKHYGHYPERHRTDAPADALAGAR